MFLLIFLIITSFTLSYITWWLYTHRDCELFNPFTSLHKLLPWLKNRHNSRQNKNMLRWAVILGERKIELSNPADIQALLSERGKFFENTAGYFKSFTKDPSLRAIFKDVLGEGIFVMSGTKWRASRKHMSGMFSGKQINEYVAHTFEPDANELSEKLQEFVDKETFDLQKYIQLYTLTTILKITFGNKYKNDMFAKENIEFIRATDWLMNHCAQCLRLPLWRICRWYHVYYTEKYPTNLKIFYEFIQKYKKDDMSVDTITNLILAGKDTTAATISWLIYELCQPRNEKYYNKYFSLQGNEKKEYLQRIIFETLRIHPAVPLEYKKCVSPHTFPSGIKANVGDVFGHSPYLLGRRNDGTWGDISADEFNPDRWDEVNKKLNLTRGFNTALYQYLTSVFNAGPRKCLGRSFALKEIEVLTNKLLEMFDIKIDNGKTSGLPNTNLVTAISRGLWVDISNKSDHRRANFKDGFILDNGKMD